MQRGEAVVVGLQGVGESMFGDEEVDEEVNPLSQCVEWGAGTGQQIRAGLGACLDLVVVDGCDEIRPGREVSTVSRLRRASARLPRDGDCPAGLSVAITYSFHSD